MSNSAYFMTVFAFAMLAVREQIRELGRAAWGAAILAAHRNGRLAHYGNAGIATVHTSVPLSCAC